VGCTTLESGTPRSFRRGAHWISDTEACERETAGYEPARERDNRLRACERETPGYERLEISDTEAWREGRGCRQVMSLSFARNVQRFRGGLVFKAHRLCVSLNARLGSNKEEESTGGGGS